MGTVLLATDGSEDATRAAEQAIDVAEDRDATLHVLCVTDRRKYDEPALGSGELAIIEAEDHGNECVVTVREMAQGSGVAVEGSTRRGVPHEVILEYADEIDADVIVVGEHGEHEEHLGGVGRKIAEESDREVLVVAATV